MSLGFALREGNINIFVIFVKIIIFLFLFLCLAAAIEFFQKGEYISPLTLYDLLGFTNLFLETAQKEKDISKCFLKYDNKSKNNFKKYFSKNQYYFISTIIKQGNVYKITLINEKKLFQYFFIKFFIKNAIHSLYVRKISGEYKIIRFR